MINEGRKGTAAALGRSGAQAARPLGGLAAVRRRLGARMINEGRKRADAALGRSFAQAARPLGGWQRYAADWGHT